MQLLQKLTRKPTQQLNNTELRQQVVGVMKEHLGKENAITQQDLFKKIYGNPEHFSDLELLGKWMAIRQSLHYLRKNSYCFVVSQHNNGTMEFFVIKDKADADVYKVQIVNQIEKAMAMVKKAYIAADKKYYTRLSGNITLEGKRKLLI